MRAREDGALRYQDALEFRDIGFQHPRRNVLLCAESGGHSGRLPRHHRLHEEPLIGFAVGRDRFACHEKIFDFPGNEAPVGDVMGAAGPGDIGRLHRSQSPGTHDMNGARREGALAYHVGEFPLFDDILALQNVIAHDAPAFADPHFGADARDVGILKARQVLLDELPGDHDLPAALDFAECQIVDVGRIAISHLGRVLEMCLNDTAFARNQERSRHR